MAPPRLVFPAETLRFLTDLRAHTPARSGAYVTAPHAHAELPPGLAVDPKLVLTLLRHWRAFAPLHRWLKANVHPTQRLDTPTRM